MTDVLTGCHRHPNLESYVRCLRCDRPVCLRCLARGAVCVHCVRKDAAQRPSSGRRLPVSVIWAVLAVAIVAVSAIQRPTGWGLDTPDLPWSEETPVRTSEQRGPKGPVPAGLETYYGQPLVLGSCAGHARDDKDRAAFAVPSVRCGTLTVPQDYNNPGNGTIEVPFLLRPASDPSRRIGTLVIDPGGPGPSGMPYAAYLGMDKELGTRFDLVGFARRGVDPGKSAVHCLTDRERDDERATGKKAADYVAKCAQNTAGGAAALAHVGTQDVARDLDVLRSMLGDEKLNFLGYSYGSVLGYSYAALFKGNVRVMLLDGAGDVSPGSATAESFTAHERTLNGDFEKAFEAFARSCAADRGCAVGIDPSHAKAELDALLEPLRQQPVPAGDGRVLSHADATDGVRHAMYSTSLWPDLTKALDELRKHRSGTGLIALADDYFGRRSDGTYSNRNDAFTAIHCADDGCPDWPAGPGLPAPPSPQGMPPILVVSNTNDPATPLRNGEKLAQVLGGHLLTVNADGHGAFLLDSNHSSCVDAAGTAFLTELRLPPTARC